MWLLMSENYSLSLNSHLTSVASEEVCTVRIFTVIMVLLLSGHVIDITCWSFQQKLYLILYIIKIIYTVIIFIS